MTLVKKKITPEFYALVKSGKKRFELRLNDFEIKEGDTLLLQEWDPKTTNYTGRSISKKVSFVYEFQLDRHGQKAEIIDKGLLVIQLV